MLGCPPLECRKDLAVSAAALRATGMPPTAATAGAPLKRNCEKMAVPLTPKNMSKGPPTAMDSGAPLERIKKMAVPETAQKAVETSPAVVGGGCWSAHYEGL
jgi:hypothetical protein